jgi:hypothetical protein
MSKPGFRVVVIALALSACTLGQMDPTGFIPMQEAPQPGLTRVSPYFEVEVEGGVFTVRRINFFYVGMDSRTKQLIGSTHFPVYESRQGAYALSGDGRTLLFMHSATFNRKELRKDTGLYEYAHGAGERLLDGSARSGIYLNDNFPADAIVFKRKNCPAEYCFDSPTIVRHADGIEYVWKFERPGR